jgi:hypothetical protein
MKKALSSKLFLCVSAAALFAFSGCATVSTTKVDKINDIKHEENTEVRAFGGLKTVVLGPVFFKQDGPCSEVDFFKFVNSKMPEAKDLYRIRMEFHQEKNGMVEKQYCKYSGLAVNYVEISADEAAKWVITYGQKGVGAAGAGANGELVTKLVPETVIMKPTSGAAESEPQNTSTYTPAATTTETQSTEESSSNYFYSR